MTRNGIWSTLVAVSIAVGCVESSAPQPTRVSSAPTASSTDAISTASTAPESATTTSDEAASPDKTENNSKPASDQKGELKLEVIAFQIPADWKRVNPPSVRILDAEFSLPKAEGDEFDGRLTLMAAGGSLDASVARWSGEFIQEQGLGPKIETLTLGANEVTWVDIRGTYLGPANRAPGTPAIEPRPDYRMVAVVVPLTETHAYYIKLTAPKATVAARLDELKEFVRSAKVTLPK